MRALYTPLKGVYIYVYIIYEYIYIYVYIYIEREGDIGALISSFPTQNQRVRSRTGVKLRLGRGNP